MQYIPIDQKQAIIDIVNASEQDPTKLLADKNALVPSASGATLAAKHGTAVRSNQAPTGEGLTPPLTQTKPFEFYDNMLYVDPAGILTFVVKPIKKATFETADPVPKEIEFIFLDVPRPPVP